MMRWRAVATNRAVATSRAVATVCVLLLAGCTVGPEYTGPPKPPASQGTFIRSTAAATADAPLARWWTQLNDPLLSELIERAIKSNPSVEVAEARIREARAALTAERAKELPSTGTYGSYLRAHNLTSALGAASSNGSSDSNIFTVGVDASWEIDLFGAHRRAVQGAAASLQSFEASRADALVSLTSEVAQAYVQLRDAQQRLALTEYNVQIDTQLLALMQQRRAAGTASDLDVERIRNQLESTQATSGPLHSEVSDQGDRLAMLIGSPPGFLDRELQAVSAVPLPPEHVPIGDPAGMLRRRPDIAVAERRLAQQTALIGEDIAALFPKLTLLGDVGFTAPALGSLFNGGSFTYIAAPILQWTPFDFGRNRSKINQAKAARDEAEADYQRTVLAALEDAESALNRYGRQRNSVADYAKVRASAERAYALTEIRLHAGTASTSDLLDADAKRAQAQLNYEQALAQLSQDFVALQKSLGLGWQSDG
jgi:NodT family efflux transporter outer membrane factor (OMF) lipoprotein